MQLVDRRLVIRAAAFRARREHLAQPLDRLSLPAAHLVRMNLVLGRDLLDRLVAAQRFQRHPCLEIRREPTPLRHLVFLLYKAEYTLAHCPTSWDQLNRHQ